MNNEIIQINYNTYDSNIYGTGDRPVHQDCRIVQIIKKILIYPFKNKIFTFATSKLCKFVDPSRVKQAQDLLKVIGGELVEIETPDHESVNGMHFSAKTFSDLVNKYFDVVEIPNGQYGVDNYLVPKAEYTRVKNNEMVIENKTLEDLFLEMMKIFNYKKMNINEAQNTQVHTFQLPDHLEISQKSSYIPKEKGNPTVILSPGNSMVGVGFKRLIGFYLMNGLDVMIFDWRQSQKGKGSPTDKSLCMDAESAFQYVKQKYQVENRDILMHGYCFGGGPAVDVASRHRGVNLLLDRSYSSIEDIAARKNPLLSRIIKSILPSIVNFNNAKKIHQVTGNIAIEIDQKDPHILEEDALKIIGELPAGHLQS